MSLMKLFDSNAHTIILLKDVLCESRLCEHPFGVFQDARLLVVPVLGQPDGPRVRPPTWAILELPLSR